MFYFRYGNQSHDPGEVLIAKHSQRNNFSSVNRLVVTSRTKTLTISGIVHGIDAADLTAKLERYQRSYEQQGGDLGLYTSAGGQTTFLWRSRDTIGGVQVVAFDFDKNDGVEYTTFKSYSITFEAEFKTNSQSNLISWQETMSCRGTGGKIWKYPPVLDDEPEKQTVREKSTCTVLQSGSAVGLLTLPSIPLPYFPEDEHEEERDISAGTPTRGGAEHPVSWRYVMELKKPPTLTPGRALR